MYLSAVIHLSEYKFVDKKRLKTSLKYYYQYSTDEKGH